MLETPFDSTGRVDVDSFVRVATHVRESGCSGFMFAGYASEFSKLREQERRELEATAISVARGAFAAIISITDHATGIAVDHAVEAVEGGADALNVLPPHALSPGRSQVMTHLEAILEAVPGTPVVVQLAPALTGSTITADDLLSLASEYPHLQSVKVEALPPGRMVTAFGSRQPALSCLVGYAGLHLPDALDRGAVGVQPGSSFPELYVLLWRLWSAGDRTAFDDLHRRMIPYLSIWMTGVEFIVQVEKTISVERGLIASDHCRAPGYALDAFERASIGRFLDEFSAELGTTERTA